MVYEPEYKPFPEPRQHEGHWVLASYTHGVRHELMDASYSTREEALIAAARHGKD